MWMYWNLACTYKYTQIWLYNTKYIHIIYQYYDPKIRSPSLHLKRKTHTWHQNWTCPHNNARITPKIQALNPPLDTSAIAHWRVHSHCPGRPGVRTHADEVIWDCCHGNATNGWCRKKATNAHWMNLSNLGVMRVSKNVWFVMFEKNTRLFLMNEDETN